MQRESVDPFSSRLDWIGLHHGDKIVHNDNTSFVMVVVVVEAVQTDGTLDLDKVRVRPGTTAVGQTAAFAADTS